MPLAATFRGLYHRAMAGPPDWVDQKVLREATALYQRLTPATYTQHANAILNGAGPRARIDASAAIRALANSNFLLAAASEGIVCTYLFYLVAVCEGILMPHLRPIVSLAEQEGQRGPLENGRHRRLERARRNLGPAISFLAGDVEAWLRGLAPTLAKSLHDFQARRLVGLRNSVAHFAFKLEMSRTESDPFPIPSLRDVAVKTFEGIRRMIHLPHRDPTSLIIDPIKSIVRYEDDLKLPLTSRSKTITVYDLRRLYIDLDSFAYALLYGHIHAGGDLSDSGAILMLGCSVCSEGTVFSVAPAPSTGVHCPTCNVYRGLTVK